MPKQQTNNSMSFPHKHSFVVYKDKGECKICGLDVQEWLKNVKLKRLAKQSGDSVE